MNQTRPPGHEEPVRPTTDAERARAAVEKGMAEFHAIRIERDTLRVQLTNMERNYERVMIENEAMRTRIEESEYQRNFYMRHSTELVANLHNIEQIARAAAERAGAYIGAALGLDKVLAILNATMQRAKDAAYRKETTPPTRQQAADDGEPIPRFLSDQQPQRDASTLGHAAIANALEDRREPHD
jgi:hypothetical protein